MQPWPPPTIIDLLRLVGALQHRNTRLLKNGLPSKRDMLAFNQLLLQPLELDDIRSFEQSGYLLFVYELGYQLDLFVEREGVPQPKEAACIQFAQSSPKEQREALHEAYTRQVLWNEWLHLDHVRDQPPDDSLHTTAVPVGRLQAARRQILARLPEWLETPLSTDALLARCQEDVPDILGLSHDEESPYTGVFVTDSDDGPSRQAAFPDDWRHVEGAFIIQTLHTSLQWLGDVLLHPRTHEWHYLPTSEALPHPSDIIVQSNLDLMLFPGSDQLALMWSLESFCKPLDGEQILRLHIDKKRFFGALQQGKDFEQMLQLLEGASRTPLPGNVKQLLQSWFTQSNQIVISKRGAIVEASTAEEFASLCDEWPDDLPFRVLDERRRFVPFHAQEQLRAWLLQRQKPTQEIDYLRIPPKCIRIDAALQVEVIPPYDLLLLPFLDRIAEQIPDTHGRIRYQITAESLAHAVEHALSFEEILEFLGARAKIFSSTARLRLEAFAGQHSDLTVETMSILRTPTPTLLDRLLHEGGLGDYLQRLGPNAAAVIPSRLDEANEILRSFSLPTAPSPEDDHQND